MKRILFVLAAAVLLLIPMAVFASNEATGQTTCPSGGDWVKVDGLSGFTYTYTPPANYTVTDNCYKHSTYVHFGSGATVTADEHCSWEWVGWRWKWVCKTHELSHASFKLVYNPPPPVEGCTDPKALNYDPEAEVDDGSCEYPQEVCTDETANNYGGPLPCTYDPPPEFCEDETALNYGEEGECEYPPEVCEWNPQLSADDPLCVPPPPSKKKVCEPDEIGRLFELKSETGQSCWLASYQRHPLTGDWALPRIEEQLCQCGFIAVDVDDHEDIVRDCNGDVNIQTVHLSCIGGAGGGSCN